MNYSYDRTKTSSLRDGPVGRVLDKWWNEIHDLERDLEEASREYDEASSYNGGPARRDALLMMSTIKNTIKLLRGLATSGGAFDDLFKVERDFVKKHGEPSAYVEEQRNQMFPR